MSKVLSRPGSVAPRSPAPAQGEQRGRGTGVRIAVVLTIVLVAGMMALICLRWVKVHEPNTFIQINGDPSLDGAVVVVEPLVPAANLKTITVTLGESNFYQTPVFRYPGEYRVSVTVPWQKRPVFHSTIALDQLRGAVVDLPTVLTVMGDSSLDGTVVTVSASVPGGQGRDIATGLLNKADDCRILIPIVPGQYTLTATRTGATISEQKFTIVIHTAKQIDLRKKS